MQIDRISDDSFRCTLTKEDLEMRDIKLEDFMKNNDKVQNLIHEIIEAAHDTIGFSAKGDALAMRLIPSDDGTVKIIVSGNSGENSLSDVVANFLKAMGISGEKSSDAFSKKFSEVSEKVKDAAYDTLIPEKIIVRFNSIDEASELCRQLTGFKLISGDIYKDNQSGSYYLIIRRGRIAKRRFSRVIDLAPEYGELIGISDIQESLITEKYELLIYKRAIKVLGEI